MAVMVPDRLPSRSSVGEQRLFAVLQKLPDECLVYYEPVIGFRYPDFIVVDPDLGVLIVEVKGWRPGDVRGGDLDEVVVRGPHGVDVRERHPIRQARDYMHGLQDQCLGNRFARRLLLHESGPRQGRFVFPFGHFAILSNITAPQLAAHEFGDLTRIFPPARVVPRDELVRWEGLSGEQVRAELARYFDPTWSFPRLTDEQVNRFGLSSTRRSRSRSLPRSSSWPSLTTGKSRWPARSATDTGSCTASRGAARRSCF
jgi:hypothetical protein